MVGLCPKVTGNVSHAKVDSGMGRFIAGRGVYAPRPKPRAVMDARIGQHAVGFTLLRAAAQ